MVTLETEVGLLVGCHVVEVGMRQAWPFLTFADPASGRETRLYVDASIRVSPDQVELRQDDERLLTALDRVKMLTVDTAEVSDGHLLLTLEDRLVWVSGHPNDLTSDDVWRLSVQQPAAPSEPEGDDETRARARLARLLRDDAAPVGFEYPPGFLHVVRLGVEDLEPWVLLFDAELHRRLHGLAKRYSGTLVPFAARIDNDDVACWDLGLPRGRVVIVHDWASPGWERRAELEDFGAWLHQAVDDCLELGIIEQEWSSVRRLRSS